MRKIYIIGDIDYEAYSKFTKRMAILEQFEEPINIVISSEGGDPMVALAFYERIKMSCCKITVTGTGLIASSAVLILASGNYRRMTKSAWVLVHEAKLMAKGRVTHIRKIAEQEKRLEDQWNELLAKNTKISVDMWKELHQNETYLSAEECKDLGLIEETI